MTRIYAEITKRDDEARMVYGYASTEALDVQGEQIEKGAIEAALPEFMRFGNIREMHQPSAVGVAKSADIDDKGLYIAAKVVDDEAWNKVKEGVYKGFSIGGKSLSKVDGVIKKMRLTEISLVDRPANPECLIDLYKADDIEGQGDESDLAKYMGEEAWDAQRAIDALNTVYSLFNKESNEDETNAGQLASLKTVIDSLKAFIASEISEPSEAATGDDDAVAMGDMPEDLVKLADLLNKGDVTPAHILELIEGEELRKTDEADDIAKAEQINKLTAELDTVKADLEAAKAEATDYKAKWEATPNYGSALLKSVSKDQDAGSDDKAAEIAKSIEALPEAEKATALIKLIHQQGR